MNVFIFCSPELTFRNSFVEQKCFAPPNTFAPLRLWLCNKFSSNASDFSLSAFITVVCSNAAFQSSQLSQITTLRILLVQRKAKGKTDKATACGISSLAIFKRLCLVHGVSLPKITQNHQPDLGNNTYFIANDCTSNFFLKTVCSMSSLL